MNKKDIALPFIVIGLSIAFVAVALGVYLSKGKSPYWISKKIAIGGLLLSFTSIANHSCGGIDCYAPVPPNRITLDNENNSNTINVNLDKNNTLTGILHRRNGEHFSFNVTDTLKEETFQKGKIKAKDGKYDEHTEEIIIELDENLVSNKYLLNLYPSQLSNQKHPLSSYVLNITND